MNRRWVLTASGAGLVLVLTGAAGYLAGQARTTAQRALQAEPPEPSVVTAPVRSGPLIDELVLSGMVARRDVVEVSGPREVSDGSLRVVTEVLVEVGDEVDAGELLAVVSGRPVLVLEGGFSQYRDLTRGVEGPDVTQLQTALTGLFDTPVNGRFDGRTEQDVQRLYDRVGHLPMVRDVHTSGGVRQQAVLPVGEVAFAASLPATVVTVDAQVGDEVSGPLLTLASGPWQVVAQVRPEERAFTDEMIARFGSGPLAGQDTQLLQVREVRDQPGEGTSVRHEAVFLVDDPAGLAVAEHQEILVEKGVSSAGSLVVPVAALYTAPDGTVTVTVVEPNADIRVEPVTVELSVAGEAAVVPHEPGGLAVGQQVQLNR